MIHPFSPHLPILLATASTGLSSHRGLSECKHQQCLRWDEIITRPLSSNNFRMLHNCLLPSIGSCRRGRPVVLERWVSESEVGWETALPWAWRNFLQVITPPAAGSCLTGPLQSPLRGANTLPSEKVTCPGTG